MHGIADHLLRVLLEQHSAQRVREARARSIDDFGRGSQVAAQQIEDLYQHGSVARAAADRTRQVATVVDILRRVLRAELAELPSAS